MAVYQHSQLRLSDHDYSDRWTVIDNTAKKLMWITVHEFNSYIDTVYVHQVENEIRDRIRKEIADWRQTELAEWVYDNMVEDVRIETVNQMDYDTLEQRVRVKIRARFYEETATFYVLKWK